MKSVFLALALMGTVTYNMTEAFATAKTTTLGVVDVYTAAARIDPHADYATKARQENQMFLAAARIEPMVRNIAGSTDPMTLVR